MIEYILEGESVELSDTTIIELNYSIADIRDPVKVNNPFSKTISIPGTPNNNRIFDFIYENNIQPGYNPNLKKNVEIRVDTIPIIVGYQKIDEVVISNNEIIYNVIVYGSNTTIFEDMGDSLITDLNLTKYEHIYTKDAVLASWETVIRDGYYYPFINYSDKKWSWEEIFNSANTYSFYPAFYIKAIVDKIFETYGYEYDSNFLNSFMFKSLIIPYTNKVALMPDILYVKNQFTSVCNLGGTGCDFFYAVLEETDPANIYYPYQTGWDASIQTPGDGYWTFTITGSSITTSGGSQYFFEVGSFTINSRIIGGTTDTQLYKINFTNPNFRTVRYDFSFSFSIPDKILKGRRIIVNATAAAPSYGTNLYYSGLVFEQNWSFNSSEPIQDLTEIKPSETLPKIKQKDLIQTLLRMFNLYIESTPNNEKLLTIEPYVDYYARSSNTIDWTYKVDNSTKRYRLMSELGARSYRFLYKDDNDYLNKRYKEENNMSIGEQVIYVETDFVNNEEKIEPISSPTAIELFNDADVFIPSIHKDPPDDTISGYAGVIDTKWNWRILSQNFNEDVPLVNVGGNMVAFQYNGAWVANLFTCSHITNYANSDSTGVSLYFDEIESDFLWDFKSTGGNLYNVYWQDYIDLIKNQNSRLLTIDVNLTDRDISNLRFYEKIFIKDNWYMLNRLLYNPFLKKSKAELLLIPTSFLEDIRVVSYYLSNVINLIIGGSFNANFQIKNISGEDYYYTGSIIIKSLDGTTISTTPITGLVPKNRTESDIKSIVSPNTVGTFNVFLYIENIYNQSKPLITNPIPTLVLTSISNIDEDSMRVNWASTPRYSVILSAATDSSFTSMLSGYPKTTSRNYMNITGLADETTYWFKGSYYSGSNYGSASNVISGETETPVIEYYIEGDNDEAYTYNDEGAPCWNNNFYDSINMFSNDDWTATSSESWLSCSPATGTGDVYNVYILCDPNSSVERNGYIRFACDSAPLIFFDVNVVQLENGEDCEVPF